MTHQQQNTTHQRAKRAAWIAAGLTTEGTPRQRRVLGISWKDDPAQAMRIYRRRVGLNKTERGMQ